MDLNLFLLDNGERGISNFTANSIQKVHCRYSLFGCTGMSIITELFVQPNSLHSYWKKGKILRAEISKGIRGHKSDFRDQFEETQSALTITKVYIIIPQDYLCIFLRRNYKKSFTGVK